MSIHRASTMASAGAGVFCPYRCPMSWVNSFHKLILFRLLQTSWFAFGKDGWEGWQLLVGFVDQFSLAQFLIFLSPNCATTFRSSLFRNRRKLEHFASICDDLFDKFPYRKYINIYVYGQLANLLYVRPYTIYIGAVYS